MPPMQCDVVKRHRGRLLSRREPMSVMNKSFYRPLCVWSARDG